MVIIIIFTTFSQKLKMSITGTVTPAVHTAIGECEEGGLNGCSCLRGRIVIPPPSLKWLLSLRGTSGEGWGEGLLPSNYSALLNSPLPTSLSWGEGIDRGLGGGNKMRPLRPSVGQDQVRNRVHVLFSIFVGFRIRELSTRSPTVGARIAAPVPWAAISVDYCGLVVIQRLQHLFRTRADSDALCQVHPLDAACGINQEFRRPGDIGAAGSCALVQEAVASDHFRLRVGKERVGEAQLLAVSERHVGSGRADADHTDAACIELG